MYPASKTIHRFMITERLSLTQGPSSLGGGSPPCFWPIWRLARGQSRSAEINPQNALRPLLTDVHRYNSTCTGFGAHGASQSMKFYTVYSKVLIWGKKKKVNQQSLQYLVKYLRKSDCFRKKWYLYDLAKLQYYTRFTVDFSKCS